MRLPAIQGLIDRRLLINFRVDPETLSHVCPAPFRPQLVEGYGIAGICLIRLKHVRPKFLPNLIGIASENAAHRIAVEWDSDTGTQTGVYVPRRDTSSRLNSFAGGRIFPGVHHLADFEVHETQELFELSMTSRDDATHVEIRAEVSEELASESVFPSLAACSDFFESGSLGYSPTQKSDGFDGMRLNTFEWGVTPLKVTHVKSSYFDDLSLFPTGSTTFDNALLMRGIEHEWISCEPICGA